MNVCRLFSFFALTFGLSVQAFGIPVIVAPKISTPITIDGKINEAAWQSIGWSKPFVIITNGKKTSAVSRFKIAYDETHLYIATSFTIPAGGKLVTSSSADAHDGNLWEEDCVEIFLNPNINDEFNYYHFIVNANASRYDALGMSAGWDARWVAATHIEKGIWQTELAIPFSSFGAKAPKTGDVWRINVARDDKVNDEITAWSATFSRSLHIGQRFGLLVFNKITAQAKKQIANAKKKIPCVIDMSNTPVPLKYRYSGLSDEKYLAFRQIADKDKENLRKRILIIWKDNPQIYPKKFAIPSPFPKQLQEVAVFAGRNEHRSAVVNFFNPLKYGMDVRVWISMPKGDNREKWNKLKRAIRFYRPIFVQAKTKKYMADPMPPLDLSGVITVPAGQCRQLWLDVDTHYLQAGSYRAILNIKSLDRHINARYWRIPVKINVWDFTVPAKMPITVQMWEDTETRVPIKPWLDDMVSHYVNGFFHSWFNALNHITAPEKIGKELVSAYTIRTGLQLKDTLLPKHQRGQIMFGYGIIELFEQRLAGRFKLKFMSPRWEKVFKEYVFTMINYLKSIGIEPKDYVVELWDEADGGTARRVLIAGQYLKSFAPEMQTMMDVAIKHPAKKALIMNPVVDIWCPSLERIIAMPKDLQLYRKTGKTLWAYQCPVGITETSAFEQCRKFPWWAWKLRLDGIAYWVYDYPRDDPFDNYDWGGHPDTCMVYGDYRITSRRWESWREGMEDYLYLYLLKKLIAKGRSIGVDKTILSKYRSGIGKQVNAVVHSRNPKVVESARLKLAADIIELKKLIGKQTKEAVAL